MTCPKCGSEIGNAKFCPECGQKIIAEASSNELLLASPNKKKASHVSIILTFFILIFIVLGIIIVITLSQSVSTKIIASLKEGQIDQAVSLFGEKIEGNEKEEEKVKEALTSYAESIQDDFISQKISYSEAEKQFDAITKVCIIGDVRTIQGDVGRLHESQTSYQKGLEYLNNKDYENAIDNFRKVIESDDNYQDAQDKISASSEQYIHSLLQSIDDYKSQGKFLDALNSAKKGASLFPDNISIAIEVDDCQKLYDGQRAKDKAKKAEEMKQSQLIPVIDCVIKEQSSDLKSLYPDMICATIKNNTDRTIDYLELSFIGFDDNGYPLKIEGDIDFSGASYEKLASGEALNIMPGETWGDNMGFKLSTDHKVKTPMACVVKATFYDGSEWKNPYYEYFKEEYIGAPLK